MGGAVNSGRASAGVIDQQMNREHERRAEHERPEKSAIHPAIDLRALGLCHAGLQSLPMPIGMSFLPRHEVGSYRK